MARLPNYEDAFIDELKLQGYCLNEGHPIGKHKARLFASALLITGSDAWLLKNLVLNALPNSDATPGKSDKYGNRFTVNLKISNFDKEAIVATAWIILKGEAFPRLTTCFIKKQL